MNFFFRHFPHSFGLWLSLVSLSVSAATNKPSASDCAKTLTWLAKTESISDRLKLLVSLLDRHPNIVTANLSFKRSLLETYAHVPELRKHLGSDAAGFETTPPTIVRARYVASGEAQYNTEAIKKFLEARVVDLQGLELVDDGNLLTQIRSLKQNAKKPDGSFDEKLFTKKVRRLLQVVPFLFDSNGKAQFSRWAVDRENVITQVRAATPQELESRYGDLLKEHLEQQIEAIAEFRDPETGRKEGLGQVKVLYESLRNQFLERDLRSALTPISRDGSVAEERAISLENLPAWVSPVRGCYGGDCAILSVPYYSLVKGAKTHFIRKSHDMNEQPSGYAVSVPVQVNGKTVPYILTINGVTLTKVDVEMIVRLIAEEYQSSEVVLPDFKAHPYLVNTDVARSGMTFDKRKAVNVTFPTGWATVDAYMREHQVSGYTNYYNGPDIQRGYLSTIPLKETRFLETPTIEQVEAPRYQEVRDLLAIPLMQRGILGVQALSDNQKLVKIEDIMKILNLTQGQIQAARPLTELSSTRTLSLKEYRLAEEELGLNLQNLLELETSARAASLRALYREEPKLFTEHKVRTNPKAINALIDAYGLGFPEEIRNILKAKDLSDGQTLKLLEALKPALTEGDLSKSIGFQKQFEGTSLEAWAKEAIPQAFIRMNPADTALGRKLEAALKSNDADFALAALRGPPPRESLMLKAFQEIGHGMERQRLAYDRAADQWLSDVSGSAKGKARYLGANLNSNQFDVLFAKIPEGQRQEVEDAISEFSSFFVFKNLGQDRAKESVRSEERPVSRPGILNRLLGRTEVVAKSQTVSHLPDNLIVESFEFQSAPIPAEGAKFMMGSPPTEPGRYNNETQREVVLTQPFQMQATPVTQWQWERVMDKNPSKFTSGIESRNKPVEKVSWEDAQAFIQKMNQLDPKWNYRLPTEAEWEFMARAGTTTAYSFGNEVADLKAHAHFSENSDSQTHPVTEKRPSPWGLYDTHGNVWEWTSDWYGETLSGGVDPKGPDTGSYRVIRGGSWYNLAQFARSAVRDLDRPGLRDDSLGFRLVRTLK